MKYTPKENTCPNSTLAGVIAEAVTDYKGKLQWVEDHPNITDDQYVEQTRQLVNELSQQITMYIAQSRYDHLRKGEK